MVVVTWRPPCVAEESKNAGTSFQPSLSQIPGLNPAKSATPLFPLFGTLAESHQENGAPALGVRREEAGYFVVIKGESRRAQALGVRCEIQPAADDAGFELHGALSASAKPV